LELAAANRAESQFMAGRQHSIANFEASKAVDKIVLNPNLYKQVKNWYEDHAMVLQLLIHHALDHTAYAAAKNHALTPVEQGGLGLNLKDAIYHAEDTVKKTQGSHFPEDVSKIQTGTPFTGLFKTFFGFFNQQYNLLKMETTKASRGQVDETAALKLLQKLGVSKRYARGAFVLGMGAMVTSVLWQTIHNVLGGRGVIGAAPKKDDEDQSDTTGDYLNWLVGSPLQQTFQAIPSGGLIENALKGSFEMDKHTDITSGLPLLGALDSIVNTPRDAVRATQGKASTRKAVREGLVSAGLVGVPFAGAVSRPAGYLAGLMSDEYEPEDPLDLLRGIVSGTPGPKK
jgi:hypothetical protein